MANFNRIIMAGHLTRDPEFKELDGGKHLANFGLACNRTWTDSQGNKQEEVCFVDCTAFGKTAEIIQQYCQKGKPVLVEGRLKFEQWQDDAGNKKSKHRIVVERMQFLGNKSDGDPQAQQPQTTNEYPATTPVGSSAPYDDVPF